MQYIIKKHELRIDMYYNMDMPDVIHKHSNQITFDVREPKIQIYKRFMHEYKHLIGAKCEFSLVLAVYDVSGEKIANVVKCQSCDNVRQFHVNNNYIKKYKEVFKVIQ